MSGPVQERPGCLDAETMAAYIDGQLDTADAAEVELHLAACQECYEVFSDVVGIRGQSVDPLPFPQPDPEVAGRPSRRWVFGAVAAIAAALMVWVLAPRPDSSTDGHGLTDFAAALGDTRRFEARLTGGFRFGVLQGEARAGSPAFELPAEAQIVSGHIKLAVERDRSASNLASYGAVRLIEGHWDDAVSAFQEATTVDATNAKVWSDLSAAHLARRAATGLDIDLPRALEAAERALALDPRLPEGWFNKALALEALSFEQAREAWEHYLTLDDSSGWAGEAREHLAAIEAGRRAVPDVQLKRDALFDDLLPKWARAIRAHDPLAPELWSQAQGVAGEISASSGDRLANDVVEAARRGMEAGGALRRAVIDGHIAYGDARATYRREGYAAPRLLFAEARTQLAQAGSALEWAARYYQGVSAYYGNDRATADRAWIDVQRAIRGRAYPSLGGRVWWMIGLASAVGAEHRVTQQAYEHAIEDLERAREFSNAGFVSGLLAIHLESVGNPTGAWTNRTKALALSRREGVLQGGAAAAARLTLPHVAALFADAALEAALAASNSLTTADALRSRAQAAIVLRDFSAVEALLARADSMAKGAGPSWDRVRAEIDIVRAHASRAGNAAAGILAASRALEYFDHAEAKVRLPEILLLRARLKRAAGDPDGAWSDLERGLYSTAEQRHQIASGDDRARFGDTVRSIFDEYVDLALTLGRPDAAFAASERYRGSDLGPMVPQYFQTSAEVAALLPDGVTVVDFASGEEQTAIWILRKGFAQVVRVPVGRDELAGLAAAATQPRFDEKSLRRIKQLVLDPVAELMPSGDLLVIVPDGPLHLVPFAAIPGFASRYLVQDHALVAAPSVGAWFHASEQLSARPRRRDRVTIAAEAAFDPAAFGSLPSLAFARGEAQSVAAQYPSATTLFGKDVTHAAVVDAIASSEVFHFTGHALSNAYDAAASMLVVAGDTGVDSRDIRRIRSKGSSLVVLAACDSASGIMTQSDGPMGLARALLAAEVPSVVASRWLVLDRASRDLFATFHREYVRTGDAPTALAMAQREMIARDTVSSPYVWAGFVAFGGSLQHSLQ